MGERQKIIRNAILSHEKPACEPLRDFVEAIACCGLSHLHALEDSIASHSKGEAGRRANRVLQIRRGNSESITGNLHDDAEGTAVEADSQRGANDAFSSDDTGLNAFTFARGDNEGGQTAAEEVSGFLFLARLMKKQVLRQSDELELGGDLLIFELRDGEKNFVGDQLAILCRSFVLDDLKPSRTLDGVPFSKK